MSNSTIAVEERKIQVYFLVAPEDQAVSEDIAKHLAPIINSSETPIEVNSDFNIPGGADIEKHKKRLFDADIVLALISVDFINNDDIYNRNQRVIERYNNRETVMIPILVRNFMWRSTPFVSLPVLPKNLQPLNNKKFWNSQDDAVMAVVGEIFLLIKELAEVESKVAQPPPPVEVQSAPVLKTPSASATTREELKLKEKVYNLVVKEGPNPGKVYALMENVTVIGRDPTCDWQIDFDAVSRKHAKITRKEEKYEIEDLGSSNGIFVNGKKIKEAQILRAGDQIKLGLSVLLGFRMEASVQTASSPEKPAGDTLREVPEELEESIAELERMQSEAVQPPTAVEVVRAPELAAAAAPPKIQARATVPLVVDWRIQYYRTVAWKRAGAFIIDQVILLLVGFIVGLIVGLIAVIIGISLGPETYIAFNFIGIITSFVIFPIMESSKWQGTIGKRILKLEITNKDGDQIPFLRSLWRIILRSLVFYSFFFSFGLLLIPQYFRFKKKRKFFHDELSGTVIGDRIAGSN